MRRDPDALVLSPVERAILWRTYPGKLRLARLYSAIAMRQPLVAVAQTPHGRFRVETGDAQDWALLFGGMEQRELRWLRGNVSGVAFDIGAHHGVYTVALARLCDRVIAVEPFPESAARVRENLALNELSAEIVEAAVSDKVGTAEFQLSPNGPQCHSLHDALRFAGETMNVAVTTLDALAEEFGVPDFVKLDIERGELEAFRGARELLARRRTLFLFESALWDDRRDEVHALLRSARYRVSALVRGKERHGTKSDMLLARPE